MPYYTTNAERERNVLQADLRRLQKAGDELAYMLRNAPGIDMMRSAVLAEWEDAKRRARDPYGAHLRDATKPASDEDRDG